MNKNKPNLAKYHSTVTISLSTINVIRDIKVVMLENGVFKPLIDYFIENQFKSYSWQVNVSYIVGLFIDYMITCQKNYFSSAKKRVYFLPDFIKLLHYGSIDDKGDDPLELYWSAKRIYRVNDLQNYLFRFLDWYYKDNHDIHESIFKSNYNDLSLDKKIIYWRHWSNKKYTSFLSHLKSNNNSETLTYHKKKSLFKSDIHDVKYFSNNQILDLLFKGFKISKLEDKYDIRNMMITMLMHFGGCRISEPFHLFVNDVIEDPQEQGKAFVRIYHPEDGYIQYYNKYTYDIQESNRKDYLNKIYSLKPRNLQTGKNRAGWKDLALDKTGKDNYAIVHWFPSWTGKLFWELYKTYISRVLPKNLNHPYLFVSLKGKNIGQTYTINAFRDSHQKAVKKIGLSYGKDFGTSPHSHRHAYGQNLDNAKIDPNIIQKVLHHKSPFSQLVYTSPSITKINETLNNTSLNCSDNMFGKETNIPSDSLVDKLLERLGKYTDATK